ncbi:MAG: ABC transporter ATP-binding protein, partial [Spirochaetales bacterium]|nr:ABC transporter ATP-binding protein [Spirochaetales bacterium]
ALDEPVNNLDPRHQIMLMDLLSKLAEEGRTIICVLHDLNAILRNFSSCLLMQNGSIFAYGRTKEVLTEENMRKLYGIDAKIITEEGKSVIMFR